MAGSVPRLPTASAKDFARIPAPQIQRSVFNTSRTYKTCFDADYLIPFLFQEILPGDTLNLTMQIFARISTLIFPIMDNLHIDTFFFFCPNRIVWSNWERFCGAQDNPTDSIDFEIPFVPPPPPNGATGFQLGSIFDYAGLPLGVDIIDADAPSALPFRMYNLIWNQWFRDQNLQNSVEVALDDGPDDANDYQLLKRGKRHDYFTSCLPEPQRGDAVSLPLVNGTVPVVGDGTALGFTNGTDEAGTWSQLGTSTVRTSLNYVSDAVGAAAVSPADFTVTAVMGVHTDPAKSGLVANFTTAEVATINQLREAFATQQFLERDARGGTRYVESVKSHFGVVVPDFRVQRAEYLGGGSQPVSVSAVPQTTASPGSPTNRDAQANLSAYAQVGARSGFAKSFVEHGYVIGLVNLRADITYQQGIERHWTRRTRFDFYWPEFAHLGEQAVLNREIWYANGGTNSQVVFGYQERWAEYRYGRNQLTNLFRSDAASSLEAWHLSEEFTAQPALNATFIQANGGVPLDRAIAVPTQPHVLFDSYISMKHARPMPVYSVPGLQRL